MIKIEIKSWYDGKILFSHEAKDNTIKLTVEAAVKAKVSLAYANLRSAVLSSADLSYAVLSSADLRSAVLSSADLSYAVLSYAVLSYAVLSYATLVNGEKISKCERPVFAIGGIGSWARILTAFHTDKGIRLSTGCFFGSVEQFKEKLKATHADNVHAEEYLAALAMIELHFKLWVANKKS